MNLNGDLKVAVLFGIGNVFINVILKNFVLFLSDNLDNLEKNLISLLNQIHCFDFNIYKEYNEDELINKTYNYEDISSIMLQCGTNLKAKYQIDIKEYENAIDANIGLFTVIGDRILDRDKFKNIKLIAFDKKVCFQMKIKKIKEIYGINL